MASSPQQYVTLVGAGGSPVRLADAKGRPFPTTGEGALVFSEGPTITNATLINPTIDGGGGPIIITSGAIPISLLDSAFNFGAKADGVEFSDGTWNVDTATDNTIPIQLWLQACITLKRPGYIPPGNYLYGQRTPGIGALITISDCSGLHIFGNGIESNLVFVTRVTGQPTKNRQGIVLGSQTPGVCWVSPEPSPYHITADVGTEDLIWNINDTSAFRRGMHLFPSDSSQPVQSNSTVFAPPAQGGIAYYLSCYVEVRDVLSPTQILLAGSPEFNFNANTTTLGYLKAPVTGIIIENIRFTYDTSNSPKNGAFSCLGLHGFQDASIYGVSVRNATSRAFVFRRGRDLDIDLLESVATDPDDGSLCSISDMIAHGTLRRLRSVGGTHAVDFLGAVRTPSSHFIVEGVTARDVGGSVVGSHKGAHHLWFSDIDIVGLDRDWGGDDPEIDNFDKGTAITFRGTDMHLRNANVQRVPIALRSHKGWRHSWTNCETNMCGLSILIDNCNEVEVNHVVSRNTVYRGVYIDAHISPAQNLPYIKNIKINDFQILDDEPALYDVGLLLGGAYNMASTFRELGWSFSNIQRNGGVAVMSGFGNASSQFPFFTPSPISELASQLVGPSYPMAPTTGALSATVASTAGVTASYSDGAILSVPGGTFGADGYAAQLRVETLSIKSLEIAYGGLLNVPGVQITLDGGVPNTRAVIEVDTVDADGGILTFHIVNAGDYLSAPTSFDQYSAAYYATLGTNPFAVTSGVTTMTVTDVANVATLGQSVTFSGATGGFAGLLAANLNRSFVITSIVDADHYTVVLAVTPNASTSGGGAAVVAAYEIIASDFVTSVVVRNGGENAAIGDVLTVQGGHVVRTPPSPPGPPPGDEPLWTTLTVTNVTVPEGNCLAADVLYGGSYYEVSTILAQNDTTGAGTKSTWTVTGSVSQRANFKNAVLAPLTVGVYVAGFKYTATPTNPVTPVTLSGTGDGVTCNVTYGILLDGGLSPKKNIKVTGAGASIVSGGNRRGVERRYIFDGINTLVHSATFKWNNAGGNVTTAAGGTAVAWSDFSNPVVWQGVYSAP